MRSCGELLQPDGEAPPKDKWKPYRKAGQAFLWDHNHIKLMGSLEKLCEVSPVLHTLEIFLY